MFHQQSITPSSLTTSAASRNELPSQYLPESRYAGEDCPKTVFPTCYSSVPSSDPSQPPSFIHGVSSQLYRSNGAIQSFVQDGIVTDWNAAERAIDHAFSNRMRLKSLAEYALSVTEPSWNTKKDRKKAVDCSRMDLNGVG